MYGYSIYTIADRQSYKWSYQIYFTLFVVVVVNCENNYRRNGSFVLKDHQRFLKKKSFIICTEVLIKYFDKMDELIHIQCP